MYRTLDVMAGQVYSRHIKVLFRHGIFPSKKKGGERAHQPEYQRARAKTAKAPERQRVLEPIEPVHRSARAKTAKVPEPAEEDFHAIRRG